LVWACISFEVASVIDFTLALFNIIYRTILPRDTYDFHHEIIKKMRLKSIKAFIVYISVLIIIIPD